MNNKILQQKIEFLPGVGPKKSALLNKEIGVYTINDMLHYFPFRYEDRSKIRKLSEVTEQDFDGSKQCNNGTTNWFRYLSFHCFDE